MISLPTGSDQPHVAIAAAAEPDEPQETRAIAVLKNRPFLLLWLAQAATQIGGNMVIYGLTVLIYQATRSSAAVSILLLTFLAPAVVFSAIAGVFVDRFDRRHVLIVTNLLRAAAFGVLLVVNGNLAAIYVLNVFVSIVTTFFGPAEAAMIPFLVPKRQLLAANGLFTITLNAAFFLGFALLGPLVVTLVGTSGLIVIVAVCYLVAAAFCVTLPSAPASNGAPDHGNTVAEAEAAVGSVFGQLREGLAYIRGHGVITWSLIYLGIAASLIGVLGVLGADFATNSLGLSAKDFVVVVLPLGVGVVTGILLLNAYGQLVPRRRVIESGLIALGILLCLLSVAGPISRFLQRVNASTAASIIDLSAVVSLLAVVIAIAFLAGIAYAVVAIPAQTDLQEVLPEEVRGRVFGVLNMLVSLASFLPIIIVGPIADVVGTTTVILAVGIAIGFSGVLSVLRRKPIRPPSQAPDGAPRPT